MTEIKNLNIFENKQSYLIFKGADGQKYPIPIKDFLTSFIDMAGEYCLAVFVYPSYKIQVPIINKTDDCFYLDDKNFEVDYHEKAVLVHNEIIHQLLVIIEKQGGVVIDFNDTAQ